MFDAITYAMLKGKINSLQNRVAALESRGGFLAMWDCTTGLAATTIPTHSYVAGDYFIVKTIATAPAKNYIPAGTLYTGAASTTEDSGTSKVGDVHYFDGTAWKIRRA